MTYRRCTAKSKSQTNAIKAFTNKTIVFWTVRKWLPDAVVTPQDFFNQGCPESRCILTSDRSFLPVAEFVVVHIPDADREGFTLPPERHSNQKWIFFTPESQDKTNRFHVKTIRTLIGIFNATWTFKRDSDIVYRYGQMRKLQKDEKREYSIYRNFNFAKGRSKPIAWFVSICNAPSQRTRFVKQLMEYVPVDIYGQCGNLKCPKTNWYKCMRDISRKYKFYLAFENTLCDEYVTEKLWKTFQFNMVPIVLGAAR